MKVLVDTNVFVAGLTDEPGRGRVANEFLSGEHDFTTTVLNLMELRSVLTKKKRIEQEEVETTLDGIVDRVDLYGAEISDQVRANELQRDTLLYPLDCLLWSLAEDVDAELVTFDAELLEHGATSPDELR